MSHYEVGVPPYLQPFKGEAPDPQPSRPTVLCLLPTPGAAERGGPAHKASGDMGRPWRFLGTLSAAVPLAGHCGGREKSARSSAGAGEGGGSGSACASRQDAGRRGGSALGFCEGKLLYPPVLTPRSTARLREGKM